MYVIFCMLSLDVMYGLLCVWNVCYACTLCMRVLKFVVCVSNVCNACLYVCGIHVMLCLYVLL